HAMGLNQVDLGVVPRLPTESRFDGVYGFRLQIRVAVGDRINTIGFGESRSAERTTGEQLGGHVKASVPDQSQARVGRAAEIGIAVIAHSRRQSPIVG